MLHENDFRFNNLILKDGRPARTDWGFFSQMLEAAYHSDNILARCEGIPLTPEILEKCGFVKWEPQPRIIQWRWKEGEIVGEVDKAGSWAFNPDIEGYWIEKQFLHELQNLIFALTGEELTYTP